MSLLPGLILGILLLIAIIGFIYYIDFSGRTIGGFVTGPTGPTGPTGAAGQIGPYGPPVSLAATASFLIKSTVNNYYPILVYVNKNNITLLIEDIYIKGKAGNINAIEINFPPALAPRQTFNTTVVIPTFIEDVKNTGLAFLSTGSILIYYDINNTGWNIPTDDTTYGFNGLRISYLI